MTKSIINIVVTVLLAWFFSALSMDWWSVMLAAIITGFIIPLKGFKVFLMPFLAIFIYWGLYSFILTSGNDFRLSKQIGVLLTIGEQPYLVVLITGLIGGLAAGFSGILGKQLSNIKSKK